MGAENRLICVSGVGSRSGFAALMVDEIPNLSALESGQCFPFWLYEPAQDGALLLKDVVPDSHGYVRKEAITSEGLKTFQAAYGTTVTREDIFNYVYGLLHLPTYRARFTNNLDSRTATHSAGQGCETLPDAGGCRQETRQTAPSRLDVDGWAHCGCPGGRWVGTRPSVYHSEKEAARHPRSHPPPGAITR